MRPGDYQTHKICEVCREKEAFDLYLGQWVCRPCKREMRKAEYGF